MFYSARRDEVYCKIRCPLERLEREAVSRWTNFGKRAFCHRSPRHERPAECGFAVQNRNTRNRLHMEIPRSLYWGIMFPNTSLEKKGGGGGRKV